MLPAVGARERPATTSCRHWEPLDLPLCSYGETRLDNNLVENAIRPSGHYSGRKNWLFIGHPDAGQRSAILYCHSIVVSCERRGIDPSAHT